MLNSRLRRQAGAVFSFFAACALLSSCRDGEPEQTEGETSRNATTTNATTTNTVTTVVVHMTGLLLLVPSTQTGQVMNVLLPHAPHHKGRLVFGMEPGPDVADLCVDPAMVTTHGICHVDLTKWELKPFGAGGDAPPVGAQLPAGVLNVRHLAGRQYKASPSEAARQVTFAAGWTGPTHCSLANWTYQPVDEQGTLQAPQRASLVNVLTWEIRTPTSLDLVFSRPGHPDIKVKLLSPPANGRIELILAHVHEDEVKHLPPSSAGQVEPGNADHFKLFYDLVVHQGQKPTPTNRPVPTDPKPIANRACPVDVTVGAHRMTDEANALGTYACMVATAEGP
jgi:hypothetical protein